MLQGLAAATWARRYRPVHVGTAVLVALALVLPYRWAGPELWMSLRKYSQFWRFNETGFAALAALAGRHDAAVRIALGLLVALAVALAWRRVEPVAAGTVLVASWLLLTPNVLPSYAVWLLPWLVLRDAPGLLLFTGTVQLAYLVYPGWLAGGRWAIGWDIRSLEYLPCLALALAGALRARRSASPLLDWPAWLRTP
jgi:hypothetical protein